MVRDKRKLKGFIFISFTILLLLIAVSSEVFAGKKVYFYESKTTGNYRIAADYSTLKEKLMDNGYEVKLYELREGLTLEALKTMGVDVLVIPNLGKQLEDNEATALMQFVMEGKGVIFCGGTTFTNKITIPLGMMTTSETLEDETNRIRDIASGNLVEDKTVFYVDLPTQRDDTVVKSMTRGVSKIDVYGVSGIDVFGRSKPVIHAGDTTSTPQTLLFKTGSNPPIAGYVGVGNGTMILLSDPDMFTKTNIDANKYRHDNVRLMINIIDWISIPSSQIGAFNDEELNNIIKSLKNEKTALNKSIETLQMEKEEISSQRDSLAGDKQALVMEMESLKSQRIAGMEYSTVAMVFVGFAFLLLVLVVWKKEKLLKRKDQDDSNELAYEFDDEEGSQLEFTDQLDSKVKEEDIEERLKELKKK